MSLRKSIPLVFSLHGFCCRVKPASMKAEEEESGLAHTEKQPPTETRDKVCSSLCSDLNKMQLFVKLQQISDTKNATVMTDIMMRLHRLKRQLRATLTPLHCLHVLPGCRKTHNGADCKFDILNVTQ